MFALTHSAEHLQDPSIIMLNDTILGGSVSADTKEPMQIPVVWDIAETYSTYASLQATTTVL